MIAAVLRLLLALRAVAEEVPMHAAQTGVVVPHALGDLVPEPELDAGFGARKEAPLLAFGSEKRTVPPSDTVRVREHLGVHEPTEHPEPELAAERDETRNPVHDVPRAEFVFLQVAADDVFDVVAVLRARHVETRDVHESPRGKLTPTHPARRKSAQMEAGSATVVESGERRQLDTQVDLSSVSAETLRIWTIT